MRRFVLALLLLAAAAVPALAHAFLDHAEPAVGATVAASPAAVRIWFSEPVEPAFSSIAVADASGRRVAVGKAHLDPADKRLLVVAVPRLAPGRYTVTWRVVSVDTHRTEGNFTFTVRP